jgi:hypothetical protein
MSEVREQPLSFVRQTPAKGNVAICTIFFYTGKAVDATQGVHDGSDM